MLCKAAKPGWDRAEGERCEKTRVRFLLFRFPTVQPSGEAVAGSPREGEEAKDVRGGGWLLPRPPMGVFSDHSASQPLELPE